MKLRILHIILLMATFTISKLNAQLSPGDLTNAHADLEGISNCTQCHTLGEKVSNDKCLDCHKEIKSLINRGQGYHVSREVRGKDCATCHSEHHGRKFDMLRFDEDNFNHNLTGYRLTGAHQTTDCRQCHVPDFIEDRELRNREATFLGLKQDCATCHEDYHQNTLSKNDCASCHITESFAPATKFDHNKTKFALRGQHQEVDCIDCHQQEIRNGADFQVFTGLDFANCNSCHDDAHNNHLGTNCKQCHTEASFSSLSKLRSFDHSQTHFALNGAHRNISCAACHNTDLTPTSLFQDRLGVKNNACNTCHEDVHEGHFGTNCIECHNETSFQDVNIDQFNHNLTEFALLGKHEIVECRECHTESFIEPLPHNECAACHEDYHEGQFAENRILAPDCAQCHNEEGFEVTLFGFSEHNKTDFPLDGAHLATPCFACHLSEEKWSFRNIGERCVDCHEDVHQGYINEKYYPNQACESCHITDSWNENHFDHHLTAFALEGAHAEQTCMACHGKGDQGYQHKYEGFMNISSTCTNCHENVHQDQFEREGITDCTRCHGFENWTINDFNHNKTAFKLEGRHAEIACESCHQPIEVNGEIFTQYQFDNFECIVCHQ